MVVWWLRWQGRGHGQCTAGYDSALPSNSFLSSLSITIQSFKNGNIMLASHMQLDRGNYDLRC